MITNCMSTAEKKTAKMIRCEKDEIRFQRGVSQKILKLLYDTSYITLGHI